MVQNRILIYKDKLVVVTFRHVILIVLIYKDKRIFSAT